MSNEKKKTRTSWITLERGIRCYDHLTNKHGPKPDRYFALRFKINKVSYEEGLGWASNGWTLEKARAERDRLKVAQRTGTGEVTLDARRKKAQREREVEKAKPTVAKLFAIYQEKKGKYANGPTDKANFKHFATLHERYPETIRTHDVNAFSQIMEKRGKSPQTRKNTIELLRRIVNFGVKQELIEKPKGLLFEMPKTDNMKTEMLTPEQAKALLIALDADPDQNLAAMMRLAMTTGMRRGALFGLQWKDLDFQTGHITLRGEEAKSGKTTTIPMTQAARAVLESITPQQGSNYLFPSPVHGGKRTECRSFIKRIREAAQLPDDFRPLHGLRHNYASWLASSGKVDLLTLQKLLTHSSPQMTQRYAHLADEAVKKAASIIDDCMDVAVNATPSPQQDEPQAKVLHFGRGKKSKG